MESALNLCPHTDCRMTFIHGHGNGNRYRPRMLNRARSLMVPVAGYCPRGCGQTLFVGDEGHITCAYIDCPQPDAVDKMLDNPSISAHIVTLYYDQRGEWNYNMQHPLAERIPRKGETEAELFDCPLDKYIRSLPSQIGMRPGKYAVTLDSNRTGWGWELIR